MKKNKEIKEKKIKNKEQRQYDKGQIFVKIMAGILAVMMVMSIAVTLIYALIQISFYYSVQYKIVIKEGVLWKKVQEIVG